MNDDLISRQVAIDEVLNMKWDCYGCDYKQAFSGEMKLMPAEDALFANPYKTVLEDLKQVSLFKGKYDAKNGSEHFMFGILTVMEYIADKAGNIEYTDMFIDNMNRAKYGDKAVE